MTNTAIMDRCFVIETDMTKTSKREQPPPCEAYERERSRSPRGSVYDQPAYKAHLY